MAVVVFCRNECCRLTAMIVKVTARELGGLATRDDECEMNAEEYHDSV